jgi:hypothetical protein
VTPAHGRGLQLGVGAVYKFVGFEGDPGEAELVLSAQYPKPTTRSVSKATSGRTSATRETMTERPIPTPSIASSRSSR